MTALIRTASGSTYELDEVAKKIRRLYNTRQSLPTSHQGMDGEWQTYEHLGQCKIGRSLCIIWSCTPNEWADMPGLITSPIVEIIDSDKKSGLN